MYQFYLVARQYAYLLYIATAALIAVFIVVNACRNVYARQKKQLIKAAKYLRKGEIEQCALMLPIVYKYQWQLYLRSPDKFASKVFRFVNVPCRPILLLPPSLLTLLCLAVSLAEVAFCGCHSYIVYVGVLCGFCLIAALKGALNGYAAKRKGAQAVFDKLVCHLDLLFGEKHELELPDEEQQPLIKPSDVTEKINYLKGKGLTDQSAKRIAELLSEQRLARPRTVAQQQKLNQALNGLVRYVSMHESGEKQSQ